MLMVALMKQGVYVYCNHRMYPHIITQEDILSCAHPNIDQEPERPRKKKLQIVVCGIPLVLGRTEPECRVLASMWSVGPRSREPTRLQKAQGARKSDRILHPLREELCKRFLPLRGQSSGNGFRAPLKGFEVDIRQV